MAALEIYTGKASENKRQSGHAWSASLSEHMCAFDSLFQRASRVSGRGFIIRRASFCRRYTVSSSKLPSGNETSTDPQVLENEPAPGLFSASGPPLDSSIRSITHTVSATVEYAIRNGHRAGSRPLALYIGEGVPEDRISGTEERWKFQSAAGVASSFSRNHARA